MMRWQRCRSWTKLFARRGWRQGKLGLLQIGFISGVGAQIVPSIARQFKDLNPEVEFSLLAVPTAHQLQAL